MPTGTIAGNDLIELIKADHQTVQQMLARFESVAPSERDGYFCEVVHELVRHEVAEELVLYPTIRKESTAGEAEAQSRLQEQSDAEKLLARMESLDVMTPEFVKDFQKLRTAVLHHADAEESGALPLLQGSERTEMRSEMGARYLAAKEKAPTHPHPHTPNDGSAQKLLGPVAALLDRARDAVKDG